MILVEGLIGMALVKWKLVVLNDSAMRAGFMAIHVVSTFLLLGSNALTALTSDGFEKIIIKGQKGLGWLLGGGLALIAFLGVSGAISALGRQLKPVENVVQAALNPATFWMVRVQPLHPMLGATVGLYLVLLCGLMQHLRPDPSVNRAIRWVLGLYGVQMLLGVLNILLKAPIPIQMTHLVLADLNFVSIVALGVCAFQRDVARVESSSYERSEPMLRGRELIRAYVSLTKPRVISLLLFTCLAGAFIAKGGWPGWQTFLGLLVGGYLMPGAANAINMVVDRDLDERMARTSKRPTVSGSIPAPNALVFAFGIALIAFAILGFSANLLTAMLALGGLVFYVIVYTLILKRRTWQNIVIGGAAGCFPPLVGWAAVDNSLNSLAWFLFAIIFVWTPVHFWALALLLKDDYAEAGVPMLPVVKGERATVVQISIYTAITVGVTCAPFFLRELGWIYGIAAVALNVLLVKYCANLFRKIERPQASALFHYSMLYLAALFLVMAIDKAVLPG
jgi:protoheme IX farnesyltransferase